MLSGAMGISQAYLVLDEAEAPSVKSLAMSASQLTAVVGNSFVFKFNPLSYTLHKGANWTSSPQASSTEAPESSFVGPEPKTLSLEIFMDNSWNPINGSIQAEIDFLMKCCDPTPESVAEGTPRPPYVRFGWGSNVMFKAYVTDVSIEANLFSASGTPIRGNASITLTEVPESVGRQNPTSGTPTPQRSHSVQVGDSLASIAYKFWKNPTLWRAIAEVNRLDDPERLLPGSELLIPDESDARAMA